MTIAKGFHESLRERLENVSCLHFNAGVECNQVINAHTIQKGGQLSRIAEDGHVYGFSADWSVLRNNEHRPAPRKLGIRTASTFKGFCGFHDNQLFEPIDNTDFLPNKKNAALYSYRTISRETYEKIGATELYKKLVSDIQNDLEMEKFLSYMFAGNQLGLERIRYHKSIYEKMLISENYDDMRYIAFGMSSPWTSQFAGAIFPDYDFMGRPLQDLSDIDKPLDLVTFFTAPSSKGWSVVFAWHDTSQNSVSKLINSIHESVRSGNFIGDLLFRLVFTSCENHVFNISWWDRLSESGKEEIINRFRDSLDMNCGIDTDYLSKGLEGISDWDVSTVEWESPEA